MTSREEFICYIGKHRLLDLFEFSVENKDSYLVLSMRAPENTWYFNTITEEEISKNKKALFNAWKEIVTQWMKENWNV